MTAGRRLLLAALGLPLASCATAPPPRTGPAPPALFGAESAAPRVVGRVLDATDRRPLPFAPVRVERAGVRTGTTADENGVFVVHRPDGAPIRLTVRVAGYASEARDARPRPGSMDTLRVLMHALPRARGRARPPVSTEAPRPHGP